MIKVQVSIIFDNLFFVIILDFIIMKNSILIIHSIFKFNLKLFYFLKNQPQIIFLFIICILHNYKDI